MREMGINPRRGNTKAEKSGAELTSRFFHTWTFNDENQATDSQPAGFCACICRQPQTGDIIFQISRSSQSKAIQLATHSDYSHTGMLVIRNKSPTF